MKNRKNIIKIVVFSILLLCLFSGGFIFFYGISSHKETTNHELLTDYRLRAEDHVIQLFEKNYYTQEQEKYILEKLEEYEATIIRRAEKYDNYDELLEIFKHTVDSIKIENIWIIYKSYSLEEAYNLGYVSKCDLIDIGREKNSLYNLYHSNSIKYCDATTYLGKMLISSYALENNLSEPPKMSGIGYGRYRDCVIATLVPQGVLNASQSFYIDGVYMDVNPTYCRVWKEVKVIDSTTTTITNFYSVEEAYGKAIISKEELNVFAVSTAHPWIYTPQEELKNKICEACSYIPKDDVVEIKYYGIIGHCYFFKVQVNKENNTRIYEIIATFE